MRNLLLSLVLLSMSAYAAAGCGADEAASSAAALVPAEAAVYGEVTLDPEGGQEEAVNAIVSRFPGAGGAGERIQRLIEQGLRESDAPVSYRDDVEPWLGDEAAFFVIGREAGAALVATEDEDAARGALEKAFEGEATARSHRDVEYLFNAGDDEDEPAAGAAIDGFLVVGAERALKAVIDTADGDAPLEEDEQYADATEDAADDRLGLVYVNSPALLKATQQSAGPALPDSFRDLFKDPFVATLLAEEDGVLFEGALPADFARTFGFFGEGSELITGLPADSWLAMAQPELGRLLDFYVGAFAGAAGGREAIEQQFEAATGLDLQEDVLGWMGDFAVFVRGTSVAELRGALIVETADEAASGRLIERLRALADDQVSGGVQVIPLSAPGGGDGFTLTDPSVPEPVHLFQREARVVLAYGDEAAAEAIDPSEALGDSAEYSEATQSLGDYDISFYLAVQPILELVDSTGAASEADWQDARPYLEPLGSLVGGTSGEGDELRSALKIILK